MADTLNKSCLTAEKTKQVLLRDGWIQGRYHSDGEGHCLVGAVWKAQQENSGSLNTSVFFNELQRKVAVSGYGLLTEWNDDPKRTKEEVIGLLDDLCEA